MQGTTLRPFLQTSQITLRPIEKKDLKIFQTLFQNTVAMRLYQGGTRDITDRFHEWISRWDLHPYSALAVTDNLSKKVIGHAILGHGDYEKTLYKGFSEIALILDPHYWNTKYEDRGSEIGTMGKRGIGTEAVRSLVNYARSLKELAYTVPCDVTKEQQAELEKICSTNKDLQVHRNKEGKIDWVLLPFAEIRASCNKANIAANKILSKVFIQENKGSVKPLGEDRNLYTIALKG